MSKTALLVVDMLYDFTNPKGLVYYPQNREILPEIKDVLDKCREKSKLIVFLQHRHRKDKIDRNLTGMRVSCLEGTIGCTIDEMLPVDEAKDYIIQKRRYSGFFGTDLDLVLHENCVKNVIVVGTKTNCCIRATVTDAYCLNYEVYVPKECVATNSKKINDVHLSDIDKYLGHIITKARLFEMLEQGEL